MSREVIELACVRLKAMCGDEHGMERLSEFWAERGFKPGDLASVSAKEVAQMSRALSHRVAGVISGTDMDMEAMGQYFAEQALTLWLHGLQVGFMCAEELAKESV